MFGGGVVMNWELVWRQDRFNPLPLGRYVSRIYQFDEAFAANWYVAWSNDQANTMSFPDYLGALMQFDEHTRNGQYSRWAEATSTLSYPDFLRLGTVGTEAPHPGRWEAESPRLPSIS